jgi:2TM domain
MSTLGARTGAATPETGARKRARYLSGLLWHAGAFLIVNAFFWVLDLGVGQGGLQWAFWITAVWGFALAFHALAYYVDGRGVEERKTRQYLEEEQRRSAQRT